MSASITSTTATVEVIVGRILGFVIRKSAGLFNACTAPDFDPAEIVRIAPAPRRPHQTYPCPAYAGQTIFVKPRKWSRVVPRRRPLNHAQRARQLRRRFVQSLRERIAA